MVGEKLRTVGQSLMRVMGSSAPKKSSRLQLHDSRASHSIALTLDRHWGLMLGDHSGVIAPPCPSIGDSPSAGQADVEPHR
jgi:hypothetical protein